MIEKIKKFNLEIFLFLKELHSYTKQINIVDDETVGLLTETIIAVNKLQSNSTFHEQQTPSENRFANDLNDVVFQCRRHIICCLCHEQFPMNSEDFRLHIQKKGHKENEKKTGQIVDEKHVSPNTSSEKDEENIKAGMNGDVNIKSFVASPLVLMNENRNMSEASPTMISSNAENAIKMKTIRQSTEDKVLNPISKTEEKAASINKSANNQPRVPLYSNGLKASGTNSEVSSSSDSVIAPKENIETMKNEKPNIAVDLSKIIRTSDVREPIKIEMENLMSRRDRVNVEAKIIHVLSSHFKSIDPTLKVIPVGSSRYGFGGMSTDLNLLIKTDGPNHTLSLLLNSFEDAVKTSLKQEFEFKTKVKTNRIQKTFIRFIHKASCMHCTVQFDSDTKMESSMVIIRGFISHKPYCRNLIVYIRAWQNTLNAVTAEKGQIAFQFNTYILSVLVIFYLQQKQDFPTIVQLPMTLSGQLPSNASKIKLKTLVEGFFKFYGHEINFPMQIAVNTGNMQQKSSESRSIPKLYVGDILLPDKNIAAEMTEQEVNNFVEMCQLFASQTNLL